jgi:hypothetical protein
MANNSFNTPNGLKMGVVEIDAVTGDITTPGDIIAGSFSPSIEGSYTVVLVDEYGDQLVDEDGNTLII